MRPPNQHSPPESVLAFTTITTMLSHMKRTQAFKDSESTDESTRLNALATVLARGEEVAVAVKCKPGQFEVIACADTVGQQSQGLGQQIRSWLKANLSSRTEESMRVDTDFPRIIDPSPRSDLDNVSQIEGYIQAEKRSWTFQDHISITSKLLTFTMSDTKNGPRLFEQYIVAACCQKMLTRLNHQLSQPFKASLNNLPTSSTFDVPESQQSVDLKHDKAFLSILTAIEPDISKPIPNLLKVANVAKSGQPFELYTKETQSELHTILCDLLREYEKWLGKLDAYDSGKGETSFKFTLLRTVGFGGALLFLIRTTAMKKHLKAIESHLDDMETEETEEENFDLRSIQPSALHDGERLPLWQSYLNWLMLVVGHFEAVWILTAYVTDPEFRFTSSSIKMLVPPCVKQTMLPWKDFLQSDHFPGAAPPMEMNLPVKSTEEIISFLEGSFRMNDCPLFGELEKPPLRLGSPSSGTQHSELCLASLISLSLSKTTPEGYESVLTELRNVSASIGVSNRCCPTCVYLLAVLPGGPFYVKESHSAITPCVLPVWVPEDFSKNVNQAWGGRLRMELIKMMCAP